MKKTIVIVTAIAMLMVGCQEKEEAAPEKTPVAVQETAAKPKAEEVKPIDFPVPIHSMGKPVKFQDCTEAQKAALQWAYDYFDTQNKYADEKAFYKFMKEKYFIKQYPDGKVPADSDRLEAQISGYGSDMLPAFASGKKVKDIVVMPEVPQGLLEVVPMYILLEGEENYHGVAISYSTSEKVVYGARKKFPIPNVES